MNTKTDTSFDNYMLTWYVAGDAWFHMDDKDRSGACVWIETVTQPWPTQHMITRRCPCGAIQKFVSKP